MTATRDRRIRFNEIECGVEGLRQFTVSGYVPLVNAMFEWLNERKTPVLDVQSWDGKPVAFYQMPPLFMEDAMLCVMDVGFIAAQADAIVRDWSAARYCDFK